MTGTNVKVTQRWIVNEIAPNPLKPEGNLFPRCSRAWRHERPRYNGITVFLQYVTLAQRQQIGNHLPL